MISVLLSFCQKTKKKVSQRCKLFMLSYHKYAGYMLFSLSGHCTYNSFPTKSFEEEGTVSISNMKENDFLRVSYKQWHC